MSYQRKELLQIGDRQFRFVECPLSTYLDLITASDDYTDSWDSPFMMRSSTLLRGYHGTWQLIEQRLYLIGIEARLRDGSEVILDTLFPGFSERVFAHWYSGNLTCLDGKVIGHRNKYENIYEQEYLMTVCRGVVVDTVIVNNVEPPSEMSRSESGKNGIRGVLPAEKENRP